MASTTISRGSVVEVEGTQATVLRRRGGQLRVRWESGEETTISLAVVVDPDCRQSWPR